MLYKPSSKTPFMHSHHGGETPGHDISAPTQLVGTRVFDKFAREEAMKNDWSRWEQLWGTYCGQFLELLAPLDNCITIGNRIWTWLIDAKWDVIYRQSYTAIQIYVPIVKSHTRSGSLLSICRR
jgi:hypothetical protein